MAAPVADTPPVEHTTTWRGLPIVIENLAGSYREWTDRDGKTGRTAMQWPYGYFADHLGADGDELDCYIGPDESAPFVYIVHQLAVPDYVRFDEDKCFLGFASEQAAKAVFLQHRSDGDRAYGGMSSIPAGRFIAKLKSRSGSGKIRHTRMTAAPAALHTPAPVKEPAAMGVEQRDGKWVVVAEPGGAVLSEHATEADAAARLGATRPAPAVMSHAISMRGDVVAKLPSGRPIYVGDLRRMMGGVQRFDAGPAGEVPVGIWDRGATFGAGPDGRKEKDGEEVQFTAATFKSFVDNWYSRAGRMPLSRDHQSALGGVVAAPALAWYDAFAVVQGGQVAYFKALASSAAVPPDVAQLAEQVKRLATAENPDPTVDGWWGYRSEVTPLGQSATEGLRNYEGISPLFLMDGTDEQGNRIGPVCFDWSVVNVQFQAGCQTFGGAPAADPPAVAMADEGASIASATDTQLANRVKRLGEQGQIPSAEYTEIVAELKRRGINTFPQLQARTGVQFAADAGDLLPQSPPSIAVAELDLMSPMPGAKPGYCPVCGLIVFCSEETSKTWPHKDLNKNQCAGSNQPCARWFPFAATAAPSDHPSDGHRPTTPGAAGEGARNMDPSLMKRMGFADGANPSVEEKMAAYAKCAMGDATPDEIKAMAADLDASGDDKAKAMAKKMGDMLIKHTDDDAPPVAAGATEPAVPAAMAAQFSALAAANGALAAKLAGLEADKAARDAAAKAEQEKKFSALADEAVKGGYPTEAREALITMARTDFAAAEKLAAPFIAAPAHLFGRTQPGGPGPATTPGVKRTGNVNRYGMDLSEAIKRIQKEDKVSFERAAQLAGERHPEMLAAYEAYQSN